MQVQRVWRVLPVVAIALTGLVSSRMSAARAADLTGFISPDFCVAVVIHPQRISESTLAEAVKSALPKEMANSDPLAAVKAAALKNPKGLPTGMDVEKLVSLLKDKPVRRVVLFIDSKMAKKEPASALIVQFGADIDGEGFISALTTDQQPAETNGVKYHKLKPDGAALAPDARTLIFGEESAVVKMLAKNEGDRPLLKQLQKASLNHDILVEFYAEPMWTGLTKATGKSPDELLAAVPVAGLADVGNDIKSLSLQLDFSGDTLLHLEVATGKADTAAKLAKNSQQSADDAKQQFEAMKKNPPPLIPPVLVPVASKLGDEVFAGLKIKADGSRATVDLPMPESLPDALKAAVKLLSAFIPPPAAGK